VGCWSELAIEPNLWYHTLDAMTFCLDGDKGSSLEGDGSMKLGNQVLSTLVALKSQGGKAPNGGGFSICQNTSNWFRTVL
jgi:hypothetical protein